MANQLLERHNGEVPATFEDLENLAGVGHKTASVVMSQAFGFPAFPVDTHIHRLMKQWKLTEGKNVVQTENDAKKLFPKETWNKLHLQIIFYGREYSRLVEIRSKIILRRCFLRDNVRSPEGLPSFRGEPLILFCHHHCSLPKVPFFFREQIMEDNLGSEFHHEI